MGKNNPGIGEYETMHYKTISAKEFQGGATNNFALFSKKNYRLREPVAKEHPRIPKIEDPSE
jgi:hypothetical protein